ncbi:MAG: phosphatase PAP2 family protein [Gammaproteobacteria bacterium]
MLVLLGMPIATARIYLGVHFPLDTLGAAAVGELSAWLTLHEARWYLDPIFRFAIHIHRKPFGRPIELGWVHE